MRPLGVSVIALFMLAIGIIGVASGISMLAMKEIVLKTFASDYVRIFEESGISIDEETLEKFYDFSAYAMVALGLLYSAAGWGLLNLKEWGRILAVVLCGLNAAYGLMMTLLDPIFVAEVAINVAIVWYLMRGDTRRAFGRKVSIEERILGEDLK